VAYLLGVGGVSAVVALPQPAQQVPDGVAVQQLPLPGIVAFGEDACDPAFQAGQMFITRRQGAGGDQDGAQVLDRLASRKLIEPGVAECPPAGAQFAQEFSDVGLVQPLQHEVGAIAVDQVVVQAAQLGADLAVVIGEQASRS
jgi:hypothetical protein